MGTNSSHFPCFYDCFPEKDFSNFGWASSPYLVAASHNSMADLKLKSSTISEVFDLKILRRFVR